MMTGWTVVFVRTMGWMDFRDRWIDGLMAGLINGWIDGQWKRWKT